MSQKLDRNHYFPRIVDQVIQHKLSYAGAIELRGPKWCGKTQSALQHAASSLMMQDPDKKKDYLLLDTATMGLLFESLCVRDLRVYAQANNGEIFHYHDEAGREADAVVQLRDGRYALFEMKLGTSLVDEGAKSLVRLREKIDTNAIGEPVFCAVITPGGFAMRRDDGVFVIPITCLTA